MKIAIMQPYFLPYQGYWQLFSEADVFVIFDSVKFKKRSWMARNRVLHPDESKEFNYIKLPCNANSQTLIPDVSISLDEDWQTHIKGVLSVYRRMHAPHFTEVEELVDRWASSGLKSFIEFIDYQIGTLLPQLGLECKVLRASSIDFDSDSVLAPGEWALEISKALGATTYINPCGGVDIFEPQKYEQNGIELAFLKPDLRPYAQGKRSSFVDGLSIIDMMMFCSKEEIAQRMKNDYTLLQQQDLLEI